jgi:hypothetical protein
LACSGAKTGGVLKQQVNKTSDANNVNFAPVDANTALVTITVGGNNMLFADVLHFCAINHADCENQPFGGLDSLRSWFNQTLPSLGPKLQTVYQRIQELATESSIVVLVYPQVFPKSAAEQDCARLKQYKFLGVSLLFSHAEQNFLRSAERQLNQAIQDAVLASGNFAEYVPASSFRGHEVCGNSGQWINGPSLQRIDHWPYFETTDRTFHPTAVGQSEYARIVNEYLTPPF